MQPVSFRGFAGAVLTGDASGSPDDPAVLLIHGSAQTRAVWDEVAAALAVAGRYVIRIDLRGHGDSDWPADRRYEFCNTRFHVRSLSSGSLSGCQS